MTLGSLYGFTDAELDYILNYDIKYRMGDELVDESAISLDVEGPRAEE